MKREVVGRTRRERGMRMSKDFMLMKGFLCAWSGGLRRWLRLLGELVRVERVYISFVVTFALSERV